MKKYKLTTETLQFAGRTLHRIKAVKDFDSIKAGEFGGWIENEKNLSQDDNAWIYGDAIVFDNAEVYDNAKVYGDAKVYGNAIVYGNARVFDKAKIYDNAYVCDNAILYNHAQVYDGAMVSDNAIVFGNARVFDKARIFNDAVVCDNAGVFGDALVYGNAKVCGNAEIKNNSDYIVFKNWWSSGRYFTWTRSNNMWRVGCFYGTGKELIAKAYKDSELSGREYERVVNYVEAIIRQ